MNAVVPARPLCGAKNHQGTGTCRNRAGFRTDHFGIGHCYLHGGSTKSHRIAAVKAEAAATVARLGMEVSLDPADALAFSVRLASGDVEWLRARIADVERTAPKANLDVLAAALASANERLARISKLASDAHVEERRLQLDALVVDRLGAAVTAAIDDAHLDEDAKARLDAALRLRLSELTDDDLRPRPKGLAS
jgi:hypothetical protein